MLRVKRRKRGVWFSLLKYFNALYKFETLTTGNEITATYTYFSIYLLVI